MELSETIMWYAIALLVYGVWSTIYRMNPLYDAVEGIAMGSATSSGILGNWTSIETNIITPIQSNFAANSWLLLAVVFGLCYFFIYVRRYIAIFRFVSGITMAVSIAFVVRTNAAAIWAQVISSARVTDIGTFAVFLVFVSGVFYFIYGRKTEKFLSLPRVAGRWAMVFALGALLTPMFLRYLENYVGWSVKIKNSPAWWIPYVIFAYIVIDAVRRRSSTKRQEIAAKT